MTVNQSELDEISAAGAARRTAVQYDEGTNDELFLNGKIAKLLRDSAHFRPNYARTVVQSVHDRLEIEAVSIVPTATGAAVQTQWDDNDLDSLLDDTLRDTLVGGDHYVIIWPGEQDGTVDVIAHSSENVRVWYDLSQPRKPIRAIKVWKQSGQWRVWECTPTRVFRWISPPGDKDLKADKLVQFEETNEAGAVVTPAEEDNPFGEVPVVHFRTKRPYGRPEHRDAYGPQDAINKLIASGMSSVDYQAFPQRYALQEVGKTPSGTLWDDDDDDATPTGDTAKPKYSADPGQVWWLDAKAVGQFASADADAFLKPLSAQIEAMAATTQTPVFHLVAGPQSPSGEERRASESPLMAKVRRRQRSFERSIEHVVRLIAVALGVPFESAQVRWADPSRLDDKSKWDTALAKQQAGVPRKQALLEAGYDEDTVNKWEAAGLLAAPLPPTQPPPGTPGQPPGGTNA